MSWIGPQPNNFNPTATGFWNNVLNQFPNWQGAVNANGNTLSGLGSTTFQVSLPALTSLWGPTGFQVGIGVTNTGQIDSPLTVFGVTHLALTSASNVGARLLLGSGIGQWIFYTNNFVGQDFAISDPFGVRQIYCGNDGAYGMIFLSTHFAEATPGFFPYQAASRGSVQIWLDTNNNLLKFSVMYPNGSTIKRGSIALS